MSPAAAFVDTGKASDCLMGSEVADERRQRQFRKEQTAYLVEAETVAGSGRRQDGRYNSPLKFFPGVGLPAP